MEDARELCAEAFHGRASDDCLVLVHTEPPTEDGEHSTYVFSFWADGFGDEDEMEHLHDHYTLNELPNLPIEFV